MASRHTGPARIGLSLLAVVLAVVLLAGCGGSSGVHTQTPTSDPSTTGTGTSTVSTSTSPSITPTPSITSSVRSTATIPTPSVTPIAQDSVNRYMDFYNSLNQADRDPAHANITHLNTFLTDTALTLFDGVITGQAKAGLAYRGTPEDPRVSVSQVISPAFIFLSSCPLASKTDPFVQYTVATGKPVSVSTPSVPPPYKRTISMKKTADGTWKVSDLLVDSSKTCTA